MHFSTKERVPLLICLEVSEVVLPASLTTLARAGSGMISAGVVNSGSNNAPVATATAGTGGALVALGGGGNGVGVGAVIGGGGGGGGGVGVAGRGEAVMTAAVRGEGAEAAQAQAVEAEHAGEAGLMDRFRGTVRSFVKVRSVLLHPFVWCDNAYPRSWAGAHGNVSPGWLLAVRSVLGRFAPAPQCSFVRSKSHRGARLCSNKNNPQMSAVTYVLPVHI